MHTEFRFQRFVGNRMFGRVRWKQGTLGVLIMLGSSKQLLVINDIAENNIMNKDKSITLAVLAAAALPLS